MNFVVRFERSGYSGHQQSFALAMKYGSGAPSFEDLLDGFVTAWTASGSVVEAQPTSVDAVNLNVTLNLSGLLGGADRPDPWVAGGGSPTLCSPAVSYTVKKHTLQIGRKHRGRFQLPWAVESEVSTGGFLDSSLVDDYNAALEVFRLALTSDATLMTGPYLLHDSAEAPTVIGSLKLRNTVGTVRKRQVVGSG